MRGRALGLLAAALAGCGGGAVDGPGAFVWPLPAHVAPPPVPADNPMSEAKVALGRRLFYDRRLSGNGRLACGDCHQQARAFTDGATVPVGATGARHVRNTLGLGNVAYASTLTWANPVLTSLEQQVALPLFGEAPMELGADAAVLARLAEAPDYPEAFARAFPDEPAATRIGWSTVARALASFQRILLSFDSPYDRFLAGDPGALSPAAERGRLLFGSDRLGCAGCHEGPLVAGRGFFNTGLYDLDGRGAYPTRNTGLFDLTGRPEDMGRFRPPSLRNVAVTGPYMHDGSVETLGEVVDLYAAGGRAPDSPLKSERLRDFRLEPEEKADLLAFLNALTDRDFLTRPSIADPGPLRGAE